MHSKKSVNIKHKKMLTNITACDSLRKVASGHAEDSRYRYSGIRKQRLPRKRVDDCNGLSVTYPLCVFAERFFYIRLQLRLTVPA